MMLGDFNNLPGFEPVTAQLYGWGGSRTITASKDYHCIWAEMLMRMRLSSTVQQSQSRPHLSCQENACILPGDQELHSHCMVCAEGALVTKVLSTAHGADGACQTPGNKLLRSYWSACGS